MTELRKDLLTSGEFVVGCNYWASHAGTAMWHDWRPDQVEQDLQRLSDAGMDVLRIFPLWSDFQPLTRLYGYAGRPEGFCHGDRPLSEEDILRGGLSEVMLGRLNEMIAAAERHRMGLILGLVTGWMSGRLFVPEPLRHMNLIADPETIQWQVRMVGEIVRRLRDRKAILAWDLGNECNCMGEATGAQAWVWTAAIAQAIRVEDNRRPILSGMHSLSPAPEARWTIQGQAELTDMLTVHPYPLFTPHCDRDPLDSPRSVLHAAAEACLYSDVGGKPCMIEEFGTLGPLVCSNEVAAAYARAVLFSAWAHDGHGALWWCAFDQDRLRHAPYDSCAVERELGMFRSDGSPKPVVEEFHRFNQFLRGLPIQTLPPRIREGVCILTDDQDAWGAAYSSFVLAKQAGFNLAFQYHDQPLRDAELYLMPSIRGMQVICRERWLQLLERVRDGATLYVSIDDGMLAPFCEPFGVTVLTRSQRTGPAEFAMDDAAAPLRLADAAWRFDLRPDRAQVVGCETGGNPILTVADYGKRHIWLLAVPLEKQLADQTGAFHASGAPPYWHVYHRIARPWIQRRAVQKSSPQLGVTEHPLNAGSRVVVLQNHGPEPVVQGIALSADWRFRDPWYGPLPLSHGNAPAGVLEPNQVSVFTLDSGARA